MIRSEIGCLCLFLACLLIHLLAGNGGKSFPTGCITSFLRHWLVGCASDGQRSRLFGQLHAVQHRHRQPEGAGSPLLCHLPGRGAHRLLDGALQKLHLPKAAGIGTAVVLRFFPTIASEYRAIRSSQRFRGIGVGVLHTLTHLPTTVEYILIPLILRTTKVAEELSASMTVRGVRFSGETVSYRSIRFCWKDAALLALLLAVACTVLLLERSGVL